MLHAFLKGNNPVAFLHDVVHILHRGDRAHFALLLLPGFDAGATGENLTARLEKLLRLLDGIKLVRADLLIFNAFSHQKNFGFVLLPEAKIGITQGVPASLRVVA